jgi:UDP-glucose 4-epimerase
VAGRTCAISILSGRTKSGTIGEDPVGHPELTSCRSFARLAAGGVEKLSVFGATTPRRTGPGVRDYIHVMGPRGGACHGPRRAGACDKGSVRPVNLGTGRGTSVLDLVGRFEAVNGVSIAREITSRRPGDVAVC